MKLFIGCASSEEIDKKYVDDCKKYLSKLLKDNDLVFGADRKGLMKIAYDTAKENGRKVIGICPERYKDDFKQIDCDKELTTKTVHERTSLLEKESDACIFLPGGIGTIYEFFSLIESKRSHEFDKPIIIYNSHNYFKELIELLNKIYKDKFTSKETSNLYHIIDNYEDTVKYLKKR